VRVGHAGEASLPDGPPLPPEGHEHRLATRRINSVRMRAKGLLRCGKRLGLTLPSIT
jgi:hypothetical protein